MENKDTSRCVNESRSRNVFLQWTVNNFGTFTKKVWWNRNGASIGLFRGQLLKIPAASRSILNYMNMDTLYNIIYQAIARKQRWTRKGCLSYFVWQMEFSVSHLTRNQCHSNTSWLLFCVCFHVFALLYLSKIYKIMNKTRHGWSPLNWGSL